MGHTNITSVRDKFDMSSLLIADILYILMASETKIDSSFPTNQFPIHGYSTIYRLDQSEKAGGTIMFIKDTLTTFSLDEYVFPVSVEVFCIELHLRKNNGLSVAASILI